MNICLIRPSIVVPARNITSMFTPPLGLAYVAGTLRDAGHDVTVIDAVGEGLGTRHPADFDCFLYGLSHSQAVERIPADSEIIGVNAGFSFEWPSCRALIAEVRRRFPDRLIIAGGEHVTAAPESSLTESDLDLVVLGEGERTTLELVCARASDTFDPALISGIAFKTASGEVVVNPRQPRMRNVDEIPLPAWDLLPIEAYLDQGLGFGVDRGRSMPLLASRGCPYQCTFCSSPVMWTTRWIARDVDLLLDEMRFYQDRYGATNFDFYDLTAIVKKSWIVDFCRRIEERGMTFTWQLPSGTRSEAIDSEVAELLYRSGCRNLSYSPESGSPAVLARIKKRVKPDSVLASMRSCFEKNINVKCNIILGFPGETYREVFETFGFIVRMALSGAYDLSIWAFSPYPGSELFTQLSEQGKVNLNDSFYDNLRSYADASQTKSYSEHMPDHHLKLLRLIGLCLFYGTSWLRRPWRPFRMLLNVYHGTHESRSEMGLAAMLNRRRRETTSSGQAGY